MRLQDTRIAIAKRNIANGEKIIARQRVLIEKLRESGQGTVGAEKLLRTMVSTQTLFQEQLAYLQRQTQRDKKNLGR
jgi:hypothetical protein